VIFHIILSVSGLKYVPGHKSKSDELPSPYENASSTSKCLNGFLPSTRALGAPHCPICTGRQNDLLETHVSSCYVPGIYQGFQEKCYTCCRGCQANAILALSVLKDGRSLSKRYYPANVLPATKVNYKPTNALPSPGDCVSHSSHKLSQCTTLHLRRSSWSTSRRHSRDRHTYLYVLLLTTSSRAKLRAALIVVVFILIVIALILFIRYRMARSVIRTVVTTSNQVGHTTVVHSVSHTQGPGIPYDPHYPSYHHGNPYFSGPSDNSYSHSQDPTVCAFLCSFPELSLMVRKWFSFFSPRTPHQLIQNLILEAILKPPVKSFLNDY
jgi:hypothetical protein